MLFDGFFQAPALLFVIVGLVGLRPWLVPLGLVYAGAAVTDMFFCFTQTFLGPLRRPTRSTTSPSTCRGSSRPRARPARVPRTGPAGRRSLERAGAAPLARGRVLPDVDRVVEPIVRHGSARRGSRRAASSCSRTVGRKSGKLRRRPLAATRISRRMIVATFRAERRSGCATSPRSRARATGRAAHRTSARDHNPRGRAVPASLPAPLRRVVRLLVPYTRSGFGLRGALPRVKESMPVRELRPRGAYHREAGGDDRVLRRARLLRADLDKWRAAGSRSFETLGNKDEPVPGPGRSAARRVRAAPVPRRSRAVGGLCFVSEAGAEQLH